MAERPHVVNKTTIVHVLPDASTDGGCFFWLLVGVALVILAFGKSCA